MDGALLSDACVLHCDLPWHRQSHNALHLWCGSGGFSSGSVLCVLRLCDGTSLHPHSVVVFPSQQQWLGVHKARVAQCKPPAGSSCFVTAVAAGQ